MKFNKKGFAVLLALSLGMSGAALAASADSFSDVPKDHWSYEALDYLPKKASSKAWATAPSKAAAR